MVDAQEKVSEHAEDEVFAKRINKGFELITGMVCDLATHQPRLILLAMRNRSLRMLKWQIRTELAEFSLRALD